jgi:hypothetical protein
VERGAGSGDFESGEQELLSEFFKYQNSTKNRNFDGYLGLESFTAFNNRKGVPATTSISARTWCPRPLWALSFTHGYRPCAHKKIITDLKKILFFLFFHFLGF